MQNPLVMSAVQKAQYLFGSEAAAEIQPHAERHCVSLEHLRRATKLGGQRRVRKEQTRILHSYSSRFVCLVRSVKRGDGLTWDAVKKMAESINPRRECGEPIIAWAEPKVSGSGWRPMCRFGPKRRALHVLCGDLITARFDPEPVDFMQKGRGADRASDHITHLIEEKGYGFFVLADVQDYYRSVQLGRVREDLGLPESVLTHCLLVGPNAPLAIHALSYDLSKEAFEGAVRLRLPQGSRASSLIAGLLLGPVLRDMTIPSVDRIIVHGDDIAIAARNKEEAEALKKALPGVLESHPAGPFLLKRCEIHHVNDGFDYLKYYHKCDPFTGKVRRRPSSKSYYRYSQKVTEGVVKIGPNNDPEVRQQLLEYSRHWVKAFPRWRRNYQGKLLLWQRARDAVQEGERKLREMSAAKKAPS
jgi:hypothetical protein